MIVTEEIVEFEMFSVVDPELLYETTLLQLVKATDVGLVKFPETRATRR